MHCLRWWLPIFLIPLPAASPFLMILFIITYAIRTKPCAYCSVIILGLMLSSCAFYDTGFQHIYSDQPKIGQSASKKTEAGGKSGISAGGNGGASVVQIPSCWIDLTSAFMITPSLAKRRDSIETGLGWWSAPTKRGSPTAIHQRWAATSGVKSKANSKSSSWPWSAIESFLRDGVKIGYGDTAFRLKWLVD